MLPKISYSGARYIPRSRRPSTFVTLVSIGVNMSARPLTTFETDKMKASPEILTRVRRSYELMLDFYGMRLMDTETGLVGRKEDGWEGRYQNLACELCQLRSSFPVDSPWHHSRRFSQLLANYPDTQIYVDYVASALCCTVCPARPIRAIRAQSAQLSYDPKQPREMVGQLQSGRG